MTEEQTTQTEMESIAGDSDPVVSVTKGDPEKIRLFAIECARALSDD